MDWKHERQTLKRIVALLLALGLLAERAGAKPRPIRAAVFWLLRAAETIAREFVLEQFQDRREPPFRPELRKNKEIEQFPETREPVFRPELRKGKALFRGSRRSGKALAMMEDCGGRTGLPASPPAHDVADDAMRLAQSFRALAELLAGLVRRGPAMVPPAPARRSIRDPLRGFQALVDRLTPAKVAPEPPDTS